MANLRRIRRFFQITLLIDIELVEDAIEHQLQCASSRHLCWHLNKLLTFLRLLSLSGIVFLMTATAQFRKEPVESPIFAENISDWKLIPLSFL